MKKSYDTPKTPYQRILESIYSDEATRQRLTQKFQTLDPFVLQESIQKKLGIIFKRLKNKRQKKRKAI